MKMISRQMPVILAALLFSTCAGNNTSYRPVILPGIVDLTKWNSSTTAIVTVDGRYEFYWHKLLQPEDFKKTPPSPRYVHVPDIWTSYKNSESQNSSYGYATYRVRIKTREKERLALLVDFPLSAYRIWINGKEYPGSGRVGTKRSTSIPEYSSPMNTFMPVNDMIEVIIQVSNYHYYTGGLWETLRLGTEEGIRRYREKRIAFDLFIIGSLVIIGLYHFGLFLLRRKDWSPFWFGIFSLFLAARAMATNSRFITELFHPMNWHLLIRMSFFTVTAAVPVFYLFIHSLYGENSSKYIRIPLITIGGLLALSSLILPVRIFIQFLEPFHFSIIITSLSIFYTMIISIRQGREGAVASFIGLVALFASVLNDILYSRGIVHTFEAAPSGFFIFIFAQSFNLSMRSSRAFSEVESLSENLEHKVIERTEELQEERNKLVDQYKEIEKELDLARRIQQQLIPRTHPLESIYSFYKPMEKVGGDFYDFLSMDDPEKIGLFVSDVSGHGVPAAFITSMVKTILSQAGELKNDPARLLSSINDGLENQVSDNFVTAFYGIFDPGTGAFIYANAGHNAPYVISDSSVKQLIGGRSVPLGILTNEMLNTMNKRFSNDTVVLEKDTKLVLYTDGLIEARHYKDDSILFEEVIEEELMKQSSFPSKEFIERLFSSLVIFNGSSNFEDDVCIICVDV